MCRVFPTNNFDGRGCWAWDGTDEHDIFGAGRSRSGWCAVGPTVDRGSPVHLSWVGPENIDGWLPGERFVVESGEKSFYIYLFGTVMFYSV